MNLGTQICNLRRARQITQEELAAELGVTAAAVSKWENGYTLPDVLMLCALADYFEVSTDELLGRQKKTYYAVIHADSEGLAEKIAGLAAEFGIVAKARYFREEDAAAAIREDAEITCLISGRLGNCIPEFSYDLGGRVISLYLCISDTEQGILSDLRSALKSHS